MEPNPTQPPATPPEPALPEPAVPDLVPVSNETYTFTPTVIGAGSPNKKHGLRLKGPVVVAVLAVLLILGSSASAYFAYYLPNKPENVLAKAVSNTLTQTQITTSGTIDTTNDGVAAHIEYTAATDQTSHAVDLKLNATVSGIKIPIEVILVNKNLYFQVGDLSSLEGLLGQFAGTGDSDFKTLADQINKSITNHWIEVDSTLIKEAKLDCLANYPTAFNQSDIDALKEAYKTNPFITVTSHSADKVNGAAATKFVLSIDDNTLAKLNLNGSGYLKSLNACIKKGDPSSSLNLSSLKDGDKTPVTIWVDKANKRIVKYETQSTAKDKSKGVEGSISGTLSYGSVTITQPADAKPVLNLLNELNLNSLFSGDSGSSSGTGSGLPSILN